MSEMAKCTTECASSEGLSGGPWKEAWSTLIKINAL